MRYKIDMRVLSTFSRDTEVTLFTSKDKNIVENGIINSITSNENVINISVKNISLGFLQVANMITQNHNHIKFMQEIKNNEEYSFITNLTNKNDLQALLTNLKDDKQIQDFTFDTEIATISLIGYGIKNDWK